MKSTQKHNHKKTPQRGVFLWYWERDLKLHRFSVRCCYFYKIATTASSPHNGSVETNPASLPAVENRSDERFSLCWERDLNPHAFKGQGSLSPSCLPIPPSQHRMLLLTKISFLLIESRAGIEPAHGGFADRSVTTSPPGHIFSALPERQQSTTVSQTVCSHVATRTWVILYH